MTVLSASLIGSSHCVAMCGGFTVAVGSSKSHLAAYHLGRLAGYVGLGASFGMLGNLLRIESTNSIFFRVASITSSLIIAGLLIGMGIQVFRNRPIEMKLPSAFKKVLDQRWTEALRSRNKISGALLIGLFSALLPCGWLYTFVLASTATQSPLWGSLTLFVFWMGTVPALTVTPALVRGVLAPVRARLFRLSGILLILAGFLSLGLRASTGVFDWKPAAGSSAPCHHQSP